MKKIAIASGLTLTLLFGAVGLASTASATAPTEVCTEVVTNPDYKPAVPGTPAVGEPTIEVVDVPARTETVEHAAVTERVLVKEAVPDVAEVSHLKYQYAKQTKTTVQHGKKAAAEVVSDWSNWSPASVKWDTSGVEVLESGNHADWTEFHWGTLHTDYFDRDYRYAKTGKSEKVVTQPFVKGSEAVYEDRVVKEAWTETIEHKATYKTVENPDYVPAKPEVPAVGTPTIEVEVPCPTPTQPEDKVDVFIDYAAECDGSITRLISTFTTPYVLVDGEWVMGEATSTHVFDTISAQDLPEGMTPFPAQDCEPGEEEPTPTVPPTPTDPDPVDEPATQPVVRPVSPAPGTQVSPSPVSSAKPTSTETSETSYAGRMLAETGASSGSWLLILVAGALVGTGAFLLITRLQRNR